MTITISNRLLSVKPSATLAISAKAAELKAQGKDIISLSVGEPDFDTPEHIKAAAIAAINAGFTKYTAVAGIPSLRKAIAEKLKRENQLDYDPKQILVSSGAKQCLFNLMQALLNPGDEVIIPAPYWVSYPDMVFVAEAVPVFINTTLEQHYKITAPQLEKAITAKTRLLIINSPSNPSGMVYSKQELLELSKVLLKHPNIVIATDDMYEHILWTDEPFANILNVCPALYDRTVVVNGVSKAYSMTGWRIGYAAGPLNLIKAMEDVQSHSTSNPCSISQKAAEAALNSDQSCVRKMNQAFKERHDAAVQLLNSIPGFECPKTDGSFYLFPRVQKLIDTMPAINNDLELANYFLTEAGVAVVPGTAFGLPGYLRLSIALSKEDFAKAVEKIKSILID